MGHFLNATNDKVDPQISLITVKRVLSKKKIKMHAIILCANFVVLLVTIWMVYITMMILY